MKTIPGIFILLIAIASWQGCGTKETQAKYAAIDKADADALEAKRAEARVVKKLRLEKEHSEKTLERSLALAEKMKMSVTYTDASGRIVYNKAEVDPAFEGGPDEMRKFLKVNLKYPESAIKKGLEGTVFVDFVIDEKGRVRDVLASDAIGDGIDFSLKEESVRVVAAMPPWRPGTQRGKAVDTSLSIPITFAIN